MPKPGINYTIPAKVYDAYRALTGESYLTDEEIKERFVGLTAHSDNFLNCLYHPMYANLDERIDKQYGQYIVKLNNVIYLFK